MLVSHRRFPKKIVHLVTTLRSTVIATNVHCHIKCWDELFWTRNLGTHNSGFGEYWNVIVAIHPLEDTTWQNLESGQDSQGNSEVILFGNTTHNTIGDTKYAHVLTSYSKLR
jgi:hypothetical protein